MVEEDAACAAMLATCAANCDADVQARCFQHDGTRHFTLFKLRGLSARQAAEVHFAAPPRLPLDGVALTRFMPWGGASLALGVAASTADQLVEAVCDQLTARGMQTSQLVAAPGTNCPPRHGNP